MCPRTVDQQFALQLSQDQIRGIWPALALDSEETADFARAWAVFSSSGTGT